MDRSIVAGVVVLGAMAATGCATNQEPFKPCVCPPPKVEIQEKLVPRPVYCVKSADIKSLPTLSITGLTPEDQSDPGKVAQAWAEDIANLMRLAQEQRNQLTACVDPDEAKKPPQ
jgi:hypothetical protein